MRNDEMDRSARAYAEAKNRHDPATALGNCTEDFFLEAVPLGSKTEGKKEVLAFLLDFFRAFPDYAGDVETKAFGDDVIIATWQWRGTLRGEFLGYAPTGRSISLEAVSLYQFRDGKLAGERVFFDLATLFRQAGLPLSSEGVAA